MSHPDLSQHSVDRLIRELIQTGRAATLDEIDHIIERMAAAPFSPSVMTVRVEHRGLRYQGTRLGGREDSLTYHLVQRVLVDRQWRVGTTAGRYVADLQRAIRLDSARLAVYKRRGGHIAVAVAPTAQSLPTTRRGTRALAHLLVVYSADRSMIVSGYQCSDLAVTGVPEDVRWLK